MLDTSRINTVIDALRLGSRGATFVGVGGGSFLGRQLVRCGLRSVRLVDPQPVGAENIVRQEYRQSDVGRLKVDVTAEAMAAINPDVEVERFPLDIMRLSDEEERAIFAGTDLVMALTDNHAAQSKASCMALKYDAAFVAVGIYAGGVGGEVFWMRAGDPVCYRCMFPQRYERQAAAAAAGQSLDPPSDGASIFAGTLIDSIGGDIALGLLTEGANNRYGRLLQRLDSRPLLVVKLDPDWETRPGRDIVRDELGIALDNSFYFAYNAIAMEPPTTAADTCPDCRLYRRNLAREISKLGYRNSQGIVG